ncbi:MAG: lysine--tRNA ligase, partial [Leptolinea sp.]|nr:lysine--tRNA ligase [Leptolinea sp.]
MELNDLEKVRLDKAIHMRENGREPYPTRTNVTGNIADAISSFLKDETVETQYTLGGRIRATRPMGKIIFAHIEDGFGRIQLFFRVNTLGEEGMQQFLDDFDLGDFIQATGKLFRTRTGEITLEVAEYKMLAKAITPLPAAKDEVVDGEVIRHATLSDPETRYRQRYADLAVNADVRKVFQTRAGIVRSMRQFLDDHGFLEVETPILQPIYGGAAAKPFVTHHNQLKQDL